VAAASSNSFELERVERLEDLREDWIRLADQTGHPFATWEWNQCWWRWFGEDRELYTYRCRNGNGDVIAILPLYVAAVRPLRVARFLGYADMHSPICEPSTRPLVAEALPPDQLDGALSVSVRSTTGYPRRFDVADISRLLLATRVGGSELASGNGYPARLVAPGMRGFWWVKWVVELRPEPVPWWWQSPYPLQ